jgi:hypothetical protein
MTEIEIIEEKIRVCNDLQKQFAEQEIKNQIDLLYYPEKIKISNNQMEKIEDKKVLDQRIKNGKYLSALLVAIGVVLRDQQEQLEKLKPTIN